MSTCKWGHSAVTTRLTHKPRLADRDMFMRFHGGGVGHMYMCQIEPWLDSTGWGTTWPSLKDRDPDPDSERPQDNIGSNRPTNSGNTLCNTEGDEGSADEESGEDTDMNELEDEDGEDPERSEEDEEDEEDGEENFGTGNWPTNESNHSLGRDEEDANSDSSGDEADGDSL